MYFINSYLYVRIDLTFAEGEAIKNGLKMVETKPSPTVQYETAWMSPRYSHLPTFTRTPCEWLVNSGAYMHCMLVMPLEKSPLWAARSGYSNT